MIQDSFLYTGLLHNQDNWAQGMGELVCNNGYVANNSVRSLAYNTLENGTDQRAKAMIDYEYGPCRPGVAVRCSENNGYIFLVSADSVYIATLINGVEQILAIDGSNGIGFFVTVIIELVVVGTKLQGFVNGQLRVELIDETFTTGYPGIAGRSADTTSLIRNFTAQTSVYIPTENEVIAGRYHFIQRKSGGLKVNASPWKFNVERL